MCRGENNLRIEADEVPLPMKAVTGAKRSCRIMLNIKGGNTK